jgi:O-antigen ligase
MSKQTNAPNTIPAPANWRSPMLSWNGYAVREHAWLVLLLVILALGLGATIGSDITWAGLLVLGGLLGIYTLALFLARPVWSFLAYIMLIPLGALGVLPGQGVTMIKVVTLVAILSALAWYMSKGVRPHMAPRLLWPLLALLLVNALSWAVNGQSSNGLQSLGTLFMISVASVILIGTLFSAREMYLLLYVMAISSALYALINIDYAVRSGLLQGDTIRFINSLRSSFPLADPNYTAMNLNCGLLASLVLVFSQRSRRSRLLFLLTSIITVAGVVATLSRQGIVAMLLGVVLITVGLRGSRRRWWLALPISAAVLVFVLFLGGQSLLMRLLIAQDDTAITGRFWAWEAGLAMVRDYPLLGVGLGRFIDFFPLYRPAASIFYYVDTMVAHNSTIQILAETGVLGCAAWFVVIGLTLHRWYGLLTNWVCTPRDRSFVWFVGSGLAVLLASSLTLNVHYEKFLWLFVFLTFQLEVILTRRGVPADEVVAVD